MSYVFEETAVPIAGRGRPRVESQYRQVVETLYHERKTSKPTKTLTAKTNSEDEAKALVKDLKRVKFIGANDVTVGTIIGDDNSVTFWVNDTVKRGPRKPKVDTENATATDEKATVKPIRKAAAPK